MDSLGSGFDADSDFSGGQLVTVYILLNSVSNLNSIARPSD